MDMDAADHFDIDAKAEPYGGLRLEVCPGCNGEGAAEDLVMHAGDVASVLVSCGQCAGVGFAPEVVFEFVERLRATFTHCTSRLSDESVAANSALASELGDIMNLLNATTPNGVDTRR